MASNADHNGHAVHADASEHLEHAGQYDTQGYAERAGFVGRGGGGGGEGGVNPLLLLHRAMRGRYLIASAVGFVLALGAAYAMFTTYVAKYQSTGILEVRAGREVVLTEELIGLDERENLGGFIATEMAFIRVDERIHDLAIEEYGLRELGFPSGPAGRQMLRNSLSVSTDRGAYLIYIQGHHESPEVSQTVAASVMAAYLQYTAERGGLANAERERIIRSRRDSLQSAVSAKRAEIRDVLREYGTVARLDERYRAVVDRRDATQAAINRIDEQLERMASAPPTEDDPGIDVSNITLDRLATLDPRLRGLIDDRNALELVLEERLASLGEAHPTVRSLQDRIQVRTRAINEAAEEVRQQIATGEIVIDAADLGVEALSQEQLREQRENLEAELEQILLQDERLLAALRKVESLEEEIAIEQRNLQRARLWLDAYQLELQANPEGFDRVSIGSQPSTPQKDQSKRLPFSAAAGMGAFGFGVSLFLLWGLLDRRYRYVEELSNSAKLPPLVGVIPRLNAKDKESLTFAALAVHHVRNTLMLHHGGGRRSRGRVFTVTSASAGDGKTNLARALGRSFAQSGYRTLLIDADFIGHGMTTDQRLEGVAGLCEAIGGGSVDDAEPTKTDLAKLHILPAGKDLHAERIRRDNLTRAIGAYAERYEVLIIDTGPILGSLEAGFVAVEADAVLTVVSRGTENRLVSAMLDRLEGLGVRNVWAVFNKAEPQDASHSVSQGSLNSRSMSHKALEPSGKREAKRRSGLQLVDVMSLDDERSSPEDGAGANAPAASVTH